jgi:hypothetical protein
MGIAEVVESVHALRYKTPRQGGEEHTRRFQKHHPCEWACGNEEMQLTLLPRRARSRSGLHWRPARILNRTLLTADEFGPEPTAKR